MSRLAHRQCRHREHRRAATVLVAMLATAAHPAFVAAAPRPNPTDRQAEALAEEGDLLGAARLFSQELHALPESFDNRARRNSLAIKAANAFKLAFDADPSRCDAAAEGVALADAYRDELLAVYGAAAQGADEYVGMSEVRHELDKTRGERGCADRSPAPTTAPVGPRTAESPRANAPSARPADTPPNERPLIVGLAISGGLTAALLATTLGAGLSRVRVPFTGAAYQNIYGAAEASHTDGIAGNEVAHDEHTDMCAAGRQVGNTQVIDACDTWTRLGRLTLAAGVGTGVFAVTTAALAGVLVRNRHRQRALTRLRAHGLVVGAAPSGRDGFRMTLQWRF